MKRKHKAKVLSMHEEYPFKNSPQALTLESEIKRTSTEREESLDQTIKKLAGLSGVSERQIYNYRMGKTDIPSTLVVVFCIQFESNALAMAVLRQCAATEEIEEFDVIKLANRSARNTLQAHGRFLEAFDDGTIDGFELIELKKFTAASVADFHRLEQIAEDHYNRRRAA